MEGKGARDRLTIVNRGGKVDKGSFLTRVFQAHHPNQPFMHERRQIQGLRPLMSPVRVYNPGVESFLFKYVVGHRELTGQRSSDLSQTSCGIEIEQDTGVQKYGAWRVGHVDRPVSRALSANSACEVDRERPDVAFVEKVHRMGQLLNDPSR